MGKLELIIIFQFILWGLLSYLFLIISYIIWVFKISTYFYSVIRDNQKTKKLIKEALDFYLKELEISGVEVKLSMLFPKRNRSIHGYISKERFVDNLYYMAIHLNHSTTTILSTVAHETIHIAQFERGDLKDFGYIKLWKGVNHSTTSYNERPWEIEAFEQEKALCNKFLKHKKIRKTLTKKFFEKILPI